MYDKNNNIDLETQRYTSNIKTMGVKYNNTYDGSLVPSFVCGGLYSIKCLQTHENKWETCLYNPISITCKLYVANHLLESNIAYNLAPNYYNF